MKLADLKQKIKSAVTKERIIAGAGVVVGLAGVILAEHHRREYNKILLDDDYFDEKKPVSRDLEECYLPPISKHLMDEVRNGATLMFREKRSQNPNRGFLGQFTTLPEWDEEANEEFQSY